MMSARSYDVDMKYCIQKSGIAVNIKKKWYSKLTGGRKKNILHAGNVCFRAGPHHLQRYGYRLVPGVRLLTPAKILLLARRRRE